MESITGTDLIYDYSDMLKTYGLSYTPVELYWQVGEIKQTQGWILHLSVTRFQIQRLLELVIPELLARGLSFRIARDIVVAGGLAEGGLGYPMLGKLVSIYVEDARGVCDVAKDVMALTKGFEGPAIPTDRHLGGIVYTRYGSFSPVLMKGANGQWVKHIYDIEGQLIVDPYNIPFRMPEGRAWPFGDLTTADVPAPSKLLHDKYYPLQVLKSDVKGNVIKALYFRKPWQIRSCLIKEGKANLFVDEHGRDIRDRLRWQYQLYRALHKDIPMPEVFDCFDMEGNVCLAMQFIKGQTLTAWVAGIYKDRSWHDLERSERLQLLDQLLRIIAIVGRMHNKGYVHRDITPENFLLDKKGGLFLIDMELTWWAHEQLLQPPYLLGTPGHMSPEQQRGKMPAVKEDIYALGSMILTFLGNLFSLKIAGQSGDQLQDTVYFLNGDTMISQLVRSCWESDPMQRPDLAHIVDNVSKYRNRLSETKANQPSVIDEAELKAIIQAGIDHLGSPGMLSPKNRWVSPSQKKEEHIGNKQDTMELYEGWHTGMAGPLWLVGLAKRLGFSVTACEQAYTGSWEFINENYFPHPDRILPGLYRGNAGIALALSEGLRSGLLPVDNIYIERLKSCFAEPAPTPELCVGIAGQGIALVRCSSWLDKDWVDAKLKIYMDALLNTQLPDGSWNIYTGINFGTSGILLFLLSYLENRQDANVAAATKKALNWLQKQRRYKNGHPYWALSSKDNRSDKWSISDGIPGVCLAFIKAYKVFNESIYMRIAEECLLQFPSRPIPIDTSLSTGLIGLGEVYLEAAAVFSNPIWQQRADWVARYFMTCCRNGVDGSKYWLTSHRDTTTADLFNGMSGILHFLIRRSYPEKTDHILL